MVTISSLSFRRSVAWFRCIWAVTTGGAAPAIWLHDLAPCGWGAATFFLISSVFLRIRCKTLSPIDYYYIFITRRKFATTRSSFSISTSTKSFVFLRIFTAFSVILIISIIISVICLYCACYFDTGCIIILSSTRLTRFSREAFLAIFGRFWLIPAGIESLWVFLSIVGSFSTLFGRRKISWNIKSSYRICASDRDIKSEEIEKA